MADQANALIRTSSAGESGNWLAVPISDDFMKDV
jgi:hypothetical protein